MALSPGAIAGIVIGCVAAVCLLFAIAFLFTRPRRPQQHRVEVDALTVRPPDSYPERYDTDGWVHTLPQPTSYQQTELDHELVDFGSMQVKGVGIVRGEEGRAR
jgi:hypothetical protein